MRRRPVLLALGALLVVGGGLAVWWFEPQALLLDDVVDEAAPSTTSPPSAIIVGGTDVVAEPEPAPAAPQAELFGIEGHSGSGTATVLDTPDGRVLRLDPFDFENGPDLRIYLADAPADGDPDALDDDIVDLGSLKGNQGAQNYELPDGIDLDRYATVVIWCKRFSVGFGAGALA